MLKETLFTLCNASTCLQLSVFRVIPLFWSLPLLLCRASPLSLFLSQFLSLSLSRSLSLPLDHHLPHHHKDSNVKPQGGVEDGYELVLSQHCGCRLFLASEKNATTTGRKEFACRLAHRPAREDLSKWAARMARTARMAHGQMPL